MWFCKYISGIFTANDGLQSWQESKGLQWWAIDLHDLYKISCNQFVCRNQIFSGKTATSYLRTVLTTNLALSKIKEKYKGALIDLDAANSKWFKYELYKEKYYIF